MSFVRCIWWKNRHISRKLFSAQLALFTDRLVLGAPSPRLVQVAARSTRICQQASAGCCPSGPSRRRIGSWRCTTTTRTSTRPPGSCSSPRPAGSPSGSISSASSFSPQLSWRLWYLRKLVFVSSLGIPFHSAQEWAISNFPCSLTRNMTSHSMKNCLLFIAYSDERLYHQFSLPHLYITL